MKSEGLPNGRIYEVSFGYNSKMEGYTNLSSDMPELCEIVEEGIKIEKPISIRGAV